MHQGGFVMSKHKGVKLLNGSNNFVKDNSIKSILEILLGKLEHVLDIDGKPSMSTIL
jgi:hypothetical protein